MRIGIVLAAILSTAFPVQAATTTAAAGGTHSVALRSDGSVATWGDDAAGQLGIGRSLGTLTPAPVTGLSGVVTIASGWSHVLAVKTDGTVWGWGDNRYGQVGDGTNTVRSSAVQVQGLTNVIAVAAGASHSVALKGDGTVWTWGTNYRGQLGDDGDNRLVPGIVAGVSGIRAISSGPDFVLALRDDGVVIAWGANDYGQLGDGTATEPYTGRSTPGPVAGLSGVDMIAAGGFHSLARKTDGTVWAWGYNGGGRLGDNTTIDRLTPVPIFGLLDVAWLAAGYEHSVAVKTNGSVWAWGSSGYGQIGDGTYDDKHQPTPLNDLSNVGNAAASFLFTFALRRDNTGYYAWGTNDSGQLGDGTTTRHETPILIAATGIAQMATGAGHGVARKTDGTVIAWGDNSYGQLGNGVYTFHSAPVVPAVSGIIAVAAGYKHTLALRGDGTVVGWGDNSARQLGLDDYAAHPSPLDLPGLSGVTKISAGALHSLALKSDGTVWGWGYNYDGQLGNGTSDTPPAPSPIAGLANISEISAGGSFSLVLKTDGTVLAFGSNGSGQIGDGTTVDRFLPTAVIALSGVSKIAAGQNHALALKPDGTVWAWGSNSSGELGDGTQTDRPVPQIVQGLTNVIAIAAGSGFSLALKSDGTVWSWGADWGSQLGHDLFPDPFRPGAVVGLAGVARISAGAWHSLAVRNDGSVFAWGLNDFGQIGDGTLVERSSTAVVTRENGAGTLAGNDWFLDLDPAVPTTIPADKVPVFQLLVAGRAGDLTANLQYRQQDIGTQQNVYVFALAPVAAVRAKRGWPKDDAPCTIAQLTPGGQLVPASASSLSSSTSGVAMSQGQAVTVLNSSQTGAAAGATFYVGYGTSSGSMIDNGVNRSVVTVPGGSQCPTSLSAIQANSPGALSGLWWNQSESGWGIHFTQRRNIVFAAWYTYDGAGNPKWYVASNCTMPEGTTGTTGTCNGALYEVNGPTFFGTAFDSSRVQVTTAGSLSVNFANTDNASMTYTVGSLTRTVPITRQPITSGTTLPAVNYTDLWWNPQESGWGMAISQQFAIMFLAWYVYDGAGRPVWYVASNCAVSGNGCTGTLYRTTGPAFGPPLDPAQIHVFEAGTVSLTFTDANNGTLGYTVNGISSTKTITRQLF